MPRKLLFSEYNSTTNKAKCICDVAEFSSSFSKMKIDISGLYKNFIDIKNIVNINILACYKVLFTKKGILNNYGCYILMIVIIVHFIIIIIFYAKNLIKEIRNKIKDIAFGIQNFHLLNTDNIHKNYSRNLNKTRNNEKKKNKSTKSTMPTNSWEIIKCKNYKNQTSKFYSKKKNYINKSNPIRKKTNIINISNQITFLKLDMKELKKNLKTKDNNNKFTNRLNNASNISEFLNKIGKIMKYNDEELNDLNYDLALKIDKRNYCQYYYSLLKTKHAIFFTFCNNTDYNLKIIKIDLFIFNLALEFTINAFFFSDDTMHKIYEDKGDFDLLYQLPQIIYSSIISHVFNYVLEILSLSQDAIIYFKNIRTNTYINKRIIRLYFKIKIKLILYFIISSIFLLFFWYYISMFCAIYSNTQIHLIKDTLISFIFSLSLPFIINLLPGIFRIPSLSNNKSNRKILYVISKILQMINDIIL